MVFFLHFVEEGSNREERPHGGSERFATEGTGAWRRDAYFLHYLYLKGDCHPQPENL